MDHDHYDINKLRVDAATIAHKPRKPNSWRRHYVRVPWAWVEQLRSAKRVSTYRLAHVLLYEHWRTGGKPIVLSNVFMKAEGVAPRSKSNALDELTGLGLVTIERKTGRSPRVVLQQV
jgi:hypothetical protein